MEQNIMDQVTKAVGPLLAIAEAMIPTLALMQKKYYDALVEQGFAKDDAMKIVCSQPMLGKSSS